MRDHAIEARERLYERIEPGSMVLLFSGFPPHKSQDQRYDYTAQRNFYYLTNLAEPNQVLLLLKGESTTKTLLFIEETTEHMRKWEGERPSKEAVSERSGIPEENVRYLKDFEGVINRIANHARGPVSPPPGILYLDLHHPSFKERPAAMQHARTLLENYPEFDVHDANRHLSYLRMFKSASELEMIRRAVEITKQGLSRIQQSLGRRTYEYELQADFLHEITLAGSGGEAFDTIAASGGNAAVLHYTQNNDRLGDDSCILFDLGALYGPYAADISRVYPLSGAFTKRQRAIYEAVLEVNQATIRQVRPGVTWEELNTFARERLARHAVELGLIEDESRIGDVYYHSIGHFLGLDVHDVGHYQQPLEAGMVLTIEPGLYTREEGIGIRIEDNILVTEKGHENLSLSIDKDPDAIESNIQGAR